MGTHPLPKTASNVMSRVGPWSRVPIGTAGHSDIKEAARFTIGADIKPDAQQDAPSKHSENSRMPSGATAGSVHKKNAQIVSEKMIFQNYDF